MTSPCNRNAAGSLARTLVAAGAAGLMLAACGGGGGGLGGEFGGGGGVGGEVGGGGGVGGEVGGPCLAASMGKSRPLACSTNGLPPGFLDGSWIDGLWIEETSPTDGAAAVPTKAVVRVTFNRAMATAPNVVVSDQDGHAVAGAVAIDGASILFTPSSPLSYAVTYSVVVDGGTSADGYVACGVAGLLGRCHIEFAFTTIASPTEPAIGLSTKTISLPTVAIGGSTTSVQAGVINIGGGVLTDLSVTDIAYAGTSGGWIKSAVFDSTVAPATLDLEFTSEALDAGDFMAMIRVSSPVATNHSATISVALRVDVAPGPGPLNPTSDVQAKKIAARSVNTVFAVDDIVWQAIRNNFGSFGSAGLGFGDQGLSCASGAGSANTVDADASATLTTGDRVEYFFSGCQPAVASSWILDGTPVLTVLPGSKTDAVWRGLALGKLAFQFSSGGLKVMPDASMVLTYQTAISISEQFIWRYVDRQTAMPRATVSLGAASTEMTGVAFTARSFSYVQGISGPASPSPSLGDLAGVASTAVEGIGMVRVSMSTPEGLTLSTEPGTRYRPLNGTVRLASVERTIWVDYGADGAVTLRIDDGNNGKIERKVRTSVAELDSLLSVP